MSRLIVLMVCIQSSLLSFVSGADEKPKFTGRAHPLQAMRSLPGVFHIYLPGDVVLHPPKSVELRLDGLDRQYQQLKSAGELPPEMTVNQFKWLNVGREPAKYLVVTEGGEIVQFPNARLRTGTGFAISRDGVLLTNRHVVESQEQQPLSPDNLEQLQPACLIQLAATLTNALGKWDGDDELGGMVVNNILAWLGQHCRATIHFDRVFVAVAFSNPKIVTPIPSVDEIALKLFDLGVDRREPILVPAKVLAEGAPGLPTDVAILRLEGDVLDALVSLPLAKPGQARINARIYSLGFPGDRYDEVTMSSAELSMVSVSAGQIHWVPKAYDESYGAYKARVLDLDRIEQQLLAVTAVIRPGSSGGPLVLEDGPVVGLNVAYREKYDPIWYQPNVFGKTPPKFLFYPSMPEKPESLDLAVPIDVAHKMLVAAHITPDPGPTTKLWCDGMDLYEAGNYAEALRKYQQVAAKQVISPVISKPYEAKKNPIRVVSHYVEEMIDLCQKSLK